MQYHYVIFGYPRDYFKIMFQEAIDKIDAEYIENPSQHAKMGRLAKLIHNIHFNKYLNWKYELPFKRLWFKHYYKSQPDQTVCFIFLMDWLTPRYKGLIDELKITNPKAKFVVFLEDLVSSHPFDTEEAKKFDLVISYDEGDSEKYGYAYHPTFLSKINIKPSTTLHSDFCFVGLPKNRLSEIYSVYKYLVEQGFKCDFIISGDKEKNNRVEGIKYIEKDMSYFEYLEHVVNTDCIVEIMQKNAQGYTLRTWEALLYGKKLLTNNPEIIKAPFYNEQQFIYFEDPYKINIDRINRNIDVPFFDTEKISPLNLFNLIEKMI